MDNSKSPLTVDSGMDCTQSTELPVDVSADLSLPEERIYENAHKIMQQDAPLYTNLEELRQQAAAAAAAVTARSPEPKPEYELPVYENLFSLNEYDTLRKQKHHAVKSCEPTSIGAASLIKETNNISQPGSKSVLQYRDTTSSSSISSSSRSVTSSSSD